MDGLTVEYRQIILSLAAPCLPCHILTGLVTLSPHPITLQPTTWHTYIKMQHHSQQVNENLQRAYALYIVHIFDPSQILHYRIIVQAVPVTRADVVINIKNTTHKG